jgi:hypothetical protein
MLTNVDCPLDQENQKLCGNPTGIGVCADCNFDFTYKNANYDDASKRARDAKNIWKEKREIKKQRVDVPKIKFSSEKIQYKPAPTDQVIKNIIEIQPAPFARQSSSEANIARQNEESKAALLKRNDEERQFNNQRAVQSKRKNILILGALVFCIAILAVIGLHRQQVTVPPSAEKPNSNSECGACKLPNCANCKSGTPEFMSLEKGPTQEPRSEIDATSK